MSQSTLQSDFFATLADPFSLRMMFDYVNDVLFFVKDTESRMIAASRSIYERLGMKSESEIIGKNDDDFFPPAIAQSFREDDQFVFTTGSTIQDRLEAWYNERLSFDWFVTTKVPLKDTHGKIIGLMGITRQAGSSITYPYSAEAATVLSFIEKHANRSITTAEVAAACGISERTLNRRVQETLGTTPYELILQIRVRKAAESLIKTQASILSIAEDHGFCDQSTFTQHFRRRTGMTPKQFRQRHG